MAPVSKPARPRLFTRDYTLLLVTSSLFFTSLHALTPILPLYAVEIGADTNAVGWLVGVFSITAILCRPYATSASERFGRKPLYLLGAFIFTLSPLLYIVARSVPSLLLVRALHGVGIAVFIVGAWALVADIIPPSRRGEGMGYYSLVLLVGMAVAPPIVVPLLPSVGYPVVFAGASLCAAASLVVGYFVFEPRREHRYLRAPSFLATARHRWLLVPTVSLISGAVTLGAVQSFLPILVQAQNAGNVGVFFSIYAVATLASRALVGPLSDRVGRVRILIPAHILLAATMVYMARIGSAWDLSLVAVLYATSFGSLLPVVTAIVVDRAPDESRGAALSVATSSFDLGIGLGALVFGWVAGAFGYAAVFELSGLIALGGAGLLVWDGQTRRSPAG